MTPDEIAQVVTAAGFTADTLASFLAFAKKQAALQAIDAQLAALNQKRADAIYPIAQDIAALTTQRATAVADLAS